MKKKHWIIIEISAAVLAITVLAAVMVPKFLTANKNINTANHIPDDNFRRLMAEYLPVEPNGYYTAEQAKEKSLALGTFYLDDQNIKSLKGIEYFVGVTHLNCPSNRLTELDLSKSMHLKSIQAFNNHLSKLTLPDSKVLEEVDVHENNLTSLDLSVLPNLQRLGLSYNQFKQIDGKCPKLS